MGMFDKYHWTNEKLRNRYKMYGWGMGIAILAVAAVLYMGGSSVVALLCVGVAAVLWIMSIKVQNEDKKLRAARDRAKKAQQSQQT